MKTVKQFKKLGFTVTLSFSDLFMEYCISIDNRENRGIDYAMAQFIINNY